MKKISLTSGFLLLPIVAMADCDEQGKCVWDCTPENSTGSCTATFEGSTLTISGTGEMKAYTFRYDGLYGLPTSNPAPWAQSQIIGRVNNVVIEEGMTSVGAHAFEDMYAISEVSLPKSLKVIRAEAFANIGNLEKINIPDGLTTLENFALASYRNNPDFSLLPSSLTLIGSDTLPLTPEELVIPENVTYISNEAFRGSSVINLKKLYCAENLKAQCKAAISFLQDTDKNVELVTYQKTADGNVFYQGRWYAKANDIGTPNYIKKRIYTIDEANFVAGEVNSFKIKYR